ncbi:MAG: CvpA family protein [Bacteroidota bacterium]
MVSIFFFFWFLVILSGIIGAMRGWAKEIVVSFSVIIALFMITLLESYVPFFRVFVENPNAGNVKYMFWIRTAIVLVLAFFGYQTPSLQRFVGIEKFNRERLQDSLLGFVLGFFNGFLVFGTILYYMHVAGYPYPNLITAPITPEAQAALDRLVTYLPPRWLGIPGIYFAVALAFIFVLVVFI